MNVAVYHGQNELCVSMIQHEASGQLTINSAEDQIKLYVDDDSALILVCPDKSQKKASNYMDFLRSCQKGFIDGGLPAVTTQQGAGSNSTHIFGIDFQDKLVPDVNLRLFMCEG